jgi:hypothetical protein
VLFQLSLRLDLLAISNTPFQLSMTTSEPAWVKKRIDCPDVAGCCLDWDGDENERSCFLIFTMLDCLLWL